MFIDDTDGISRPLIASVFLPRASAAVGQPASDTSDFKAIAMLRTIEHLLLPPG